MFSLSKKKNKDLPKELGQPVTPQGAGLPGSVEIDESKIKTMPEKFLPKGKESNKFLLIIIVVAAFVLIMGAFTGLLLFSESFNNMIFGGDDGDLVLDRDDSSGSDSLDGDGDGTGDDDGDGGEPGDDDGDETAIFRKEVTKTGGELVGAISFEMRKELEYLELVVSAGMPEKDMISDDNNNTFKIIGGVYSFEPGGVMLAEGDLVVEIFYNSDDLGKFSGSDLKILNWEEEPEVSFLVGEINEIIDKMEIEMDGLPRGKIALGLLIGDDDLDDPDDPGSEILPIGAIPDAVDADGDGLTDQEEDLYLFEADNTDTIGDGYGDEAEVMAFYKAELNKELDASLESYESEEMGYVIYYPMMWDVTEGEAGMITFSSGDTGETVRIMIQENPDKLKPREWYLLQASGVDEDQIKTGLINDLETAWSLDQFTAYISLDEDIYLINYNAGLNDEAGFKTTFDGMASSFHFPELLAGGYAYQNEQYGFSLVLPLLWEGYDMVEYENDWGGGLSSNSLIFRLGTDFPEECSPYDKCAMFFIDIFDFTTWDEVRLLDESPLLVNVDSEYVFTYRKSTYYGSDLGERAEEVEDVIATFVLE
ncbi:hypothetical protein HQ544_04355 [Candidatus Falkowbacteria bacterium]|nr:hypothetical protein [Candidatus Falkowbacteria bacterium]